jgi:hypothetical protein
VPSRFGPRASGQSPSATPRGTAVAPFDAGRCADATSPVVARSANMRAAFFRIIFVIHSAGFFCDLCGLRGYLILDRVLCDLCG